MNPFIVQWLIDIQERVHNDDRCRKLLEEYADRSSQMCRLLSTLSDGDWDVVTGYLGVCFAMQLRLLELSLIRTK